ncbi:MAG: DUF5694 domain-containing protein, partial [Pseudomonadota bacterium]
AFLGSAILGVAVPAKAQSDFDFTGVIDGLAGDPTRVLVLGSPHIGNMPEEAYPIAHLALMLDRLETYAPDIVAVEGLDGIMCDELRRYAQLYPGAADRYCADPSVAQEFLGMNIAEASFALAKALDALPDEPGAEARANLAALFMAAGESPSAILQWSYLSPSEREATDKLSAEMKDALTGALAARNESISIGVEVARRLGLERIAQMDDHTADIVTARAPEGLSQTLREMWSTPNPQTQEMRERGKQLLGSPEGVLAAYRLMNSKDYQQATIDADFAKAARTSTNNGITRQYLAWWQTRGLRMAANVVEAAGNQPGAKVLVIVGASHKSYLDAYLDQMHDIEIVDVDAVLID